VHLSNFVARIAAALFVLGLSGAVITNSGVAFADDSDSGSSASASDSSSSESDDSGAKPTATTSGSKLASESDSDPDPATDTDTDPANSTELESSADDLESLADETDSQVDPEPLTVLPADMTEWAPVPDATPAAPLADLDQTPDAAPELTSLPESLDAETSGYANRSDRGVAAATQTVDSAQVKEAAEGSQSDPAPIDEGPAGSASPRALLAESTAEAVPSVANTAVEAGPALAVSELSDTGQAAPSRWAVAVDNAWIRLAVFTGYAPDFTYTPGGIPPLRTLLGEAYAAVRRVLFGWQTNVAPTAAPVQLHEYLTGEVVGDLRAFDHNGDRLSYQLADGPSYGEAILNANGTFVYVPTSAFAALGGTDTFTVTIDDGRPIPGQTGTGTRTVPVTVKIAPGIQSKRTFVVDNLNTSPVTITAIHGDTGEYEGPFVGTVVEPGARIAYTVDTWTWSYRDVYIDLATDDGAVWRVTAKVPPKTDPKGPYALCASSGSNSACQTDSTQAVVLESEVRTIEKDADVDEGAQQIAELLNSYCADGGLATCDFTPTRNDPTLLGDKHLVGSRLINNTELPQKTTVTISDTQTYTNSVKVGLELSNGLLTKLATLVDIKINVEYNHQWAKSHTFTQSVEFTVPARSIGTISAVQPIYRAWGDFTVQVGNTTYLLKNVYFDSPRVDGKPQQGGYILDAEPLTPEALAALPPGTEITVIGDITEVPAEATALSG